MLIAFKFGTDFGNGKYAKQPNSQPSLQMGATAGKGKIPTPLAHKKNPKKKIHFGNSFRKAGNFFSSKFSKRPFSFNQKGK